MKRDNSGRYIGTSQNSYVEVKNNFDPDFENKWLYPAEN